MTLDPTSKQSNIIDSIKKYFIDNLLTIERIIVSFDADLPSPKIQGVIPDEWVTIPIGNLAMDQVVSEQDLRIWCATKNDPEGYRLSRLRDKVYAYLTDNTKTDNRRRIDFYNRTRSNNN